MDTLLLFASSQKWFVRAFFTLLILLLVYLFSLTIDYVVSLSGESIDSMNIRGGIFLLLFLFTVVISCVFSKGHHYRSPAIALLVIFLLQTGGIFGLTSIFHDSDFAKMLVFPIVYIIGYFAYQCRELINFYICGILYKGRCTGRSNRALVSAMGYSITAPLIGTGLRYLAILYSVYSVIALSYVYYRAVEITTRSAIKEAIEMHHDFDFVSVGSYFMDAITLYFIIILIGGLSRSIREDKIRNAILI